MTNNQTNIIKLINSVKWQYAKTFHTHWQHEYLMSHWDGVLPVFEAVRKRFLDGEGVKNNYFARQSEHLIIAQYSYWFMTPAHEILNFRDDQYALNRKPLFRDRRDFDIGRGDSPKRDIYPSMPYKPHPENTQALMDERSIKQKNCEKAEGIS